MKCQSCEQPATVHLGCIVKGKKEIRHLCKDCAAKEQMPAHNLPAIIETLIGQHVGPMSDELARLTCPVCGIKYMEFRAEGRLGCPHDYNVFRAGLEPLLLRIHRADRHVGKSPARRPTSQAVQSEMDLRRELRAAVDQEHYEEAARLRDLLRQREARDEPG